MPDFSEAIGDVAAELATIRTQWRTAHSHHAEFGNQGFPSRGNLTQIVAALCGALFPVRLGPDFVRLHNENIYVEQTLHTALARLYGQIRLELIYALSAEEARHLDARASEIILQFTRTLPAIRRLLDSDVTAALRGDPAARSVDEVLICYPSMLAIIHHRLAHQLHRLGAPLVARIIAEIAHDKTGIDTHPGADIGESFFIDHGTGVVIGETAIIGRNVRLYQGVTLGARSFEQDVDGSLLRNPARHPVLEDDVVVYAGTTILGRVTIGHHAIIGGNVWLTHDVAPHSYVLQARERGTIRPVTHEAPQGGSDTAPAAAGGTV